MDKSVTATGGMVVTPHYLATQSAIAILREGGTAMEATIAAAATLAVVMPHMNSIGGDGFWLIVPPHEDPFVIEACGSAGSLATEDFYTGYEEIPTKGPKSALTVAGTVGGWQEALDYVTECGYQRMSTARLLKDAIRYAEDGFPVTSEHAETLAMTKSQRRTSSFFERIFMPDGKIPCTDEIFCQKELAATLKHLAKFGLKSFYHGELADKIQEDINFYQMPITRQDLKNYKAIRRVPLRKLHEHGDLYNTPPPTQGLVSLAILGILDKLKINAKHEGAFIHATVEATKQAFKIRDEYIADPKYMKINPNVLISEENILEMTRNINLDKAEISKNIQSKGPGDTCWMGVMDCKGFAVSFIQSIYHEFGSEVVLPKTGILWQNRGISFTLEKDKLLSLRPGKKPFHTLNPAAACLRDGRTIVYGTRGGDGQPQTQAAIFHRYVVQGVPLQKAVSQPRWLYGRTVGVKEDTLKIEDRFDMETIQYLKERGHNIVMLPPLSEKVGHAGMLVRHKNGILEGAFDPRSNGSAAGF